MTYRPFEFMKDNQSLEQWMGALRNTTTGLKTVFQRLKAESAALQEQLERCKVAESILPVWAKPEITRPMTSWLWKVVQRLCGGD